MRKIIISVVAIFIMLSFLPKNSVAQCRQQMVYACATRGNSIYLRDFNTRLKYSKNAHEAGTRWTVVLNKDAHYRFNLCTPEGYEDDSQHPEATNPYGSTFNSKTGKHYSSFDFICQKSGMYYVSIRLKTGVNARKTCAVGILSFVGSN